MRVSLLFGAASVWALGCGCTANEPNPIPAETRLGSNAAALVADTAVWVKLSPANAPSTRQAAAMAYDAAHQRIVLFGGQTAVYTPFDDTWEWDGSNWTLRSPSNKPSPRSGHGMVWDSVRQRVLLFGGHRYVSGSGYTYLNDTWEWDGTNWAQSSPTAAPGPRTGEGLAFDKAHGVAVLFGGSTGDFASNITNEHWEWNGTNWAQKTPPGLPLPNRSHGMVFDEARSYVVMFGGVFLESGQTWSSSRTFIYDGASWVQRLDVGGSSGSGAGAYDSFLRVVVALGKEFNGSAWVQRVTSASPPGDALAFDDVRNQTVSFGGGETWIYYHRGGACATGADCASGYCVDGVCCDSASCGTCSACNLSTPGVCEPVLGAEDVDTCSGAQICDSSARCKLTIGAPCTSGSDCVTGVCAGGRCFGQACSSASECQTGFCVDGACCVRACDLPCEACKGTLKAQGGPDGLCGPAKALTDPHDDCAVATEPCGNDGTCNGAGACRLREAGSECEPAVCNATRATTRVCDGLGACTNGSSLECDPGACSNGACTTSCANDADCGPTGYCNAATCAPKLALGAACARLEACSSGYCSDGVCCNLACGGQCEACNETGGAGTCVPVSGAPRGNRTPCDAAPAGEPCAARSCDGTDVTICAGFASPSVVCRDAACSNGTQIFAATCDGRGACPEQRSKPCSPFSCDGVACATICASDMDCADGFSCMAGGCEARASCDGAHTLENPDGTREDCQPYRCTNDGTCLEACSATSDCVTPYVCSPSGACVLAHDSVGNAEEDSGCTLARGRAGGNRAWAFAWLALAAFVRRRR